MQYVKCEVMLFTSMLITISMIDFITCGNKRVKIFVPEHIKHVHHHHVRKVPVYIVTKDRPRVMHATHIEDEFEDVERPSYVKRSPGSRARATADYDDESVIQGVHRGDENREIGGVAATSSARPQTEIAIVQTERDGDSVRPLHVTRRVPYVLGNDDRGRPYLFQRLQATG